MSDVLIVQNTQSEGAGYLGELLKNDGFNIHSIHAKYEEIPKDTYSLIVILGAPNSANDELNYLQSEQQLIRDSVSNHVPVLGICLGSQLIAKAFGASVYQGKRKEIGFYNDLEICSHSRLFSEFNNPFTVFHWHGDTFDLPKEALRLVCSKTYQNQAFQIQSAVGLQFHLEVNQKMINLWLDNTWNTLEQIPYIDPQNIRSNIMNNIPIIKLNMEKFYKNFKLEFHL